MALEIRSIPVMTGETAERFVREAEENAHSYRTVRRVYQTVLLLVVHTDCHCCRYEEDENFTKDIGV